MSYSINRVEPEDGMAFLRTMFPDAKADDMNAVLFSTSGIHGTYSTIEGCEADPAENGELVTFLIIHPRIVTMRYGNCRPESPGDFAFLKELRATSHAALATIGVAALHQAHQKEGA